MVCADAPASPVDAGDAAVPAEVAAALNGVENNPNSSGSDDQTSAAPALGAAEQAGADTTPAESDVNHARIAREAAAEANNVAGEAPANVSAAPIDVSIAMMPHSLEDAIAAVAAAAVQHQQMQQPPTSGAQPLYSASSPADSMAGQASDSNGAAADADVLQIAARLQRKEQPAFIQTSALISNVSYDSKTLLTLFGSSNCVCCVVFGRRWFALRCMRADPAACNAATRQPFASSSNHKQHHRSIQQHTISGSRSAGNTC
jgi:hypothetical protein